jgi:SPP1 family predicted phage head-tail adaptor
MIKHSGELDRRITIQQPLVADFNTTLSVSNYDSRVADDFGQTDDSCLTTTVNDLGGVSADNYGQRTKDFETLATVWSKVVEGIGKEGEEGEQITASKKVDFFIRYRNDINEQMRVVYNSNTYKIEAIQVADARKAFLMIRTKWAD